MDKWFDLVRKILGVKPPSQKQTPAHEQSLETPPVQSPRNDEPTPTVDTMPVEARNPAAVGTHQVAAGLTSIREERQRNWANQQQAAREQRQADREKKQSERRDKQDAFVRHLEANLEKLKTVLSQRLSRLEDFKAKQASAVSAAHRDRFRAWIATEEGRIADTKQKIDQANENISRARTRFGQ